MSKLNAVPKPNHERGKPKRGEHTKITAKVRKEVERRASEKEGFLSCEWCGCSNPSYRFEKAHLTNASQGGSGSEPWNISNLCGPRTENNTCHQIADDTLAGKVMKRLLAKKLLKYYTTGKGKDIWPYEGG